MKTRLLWLVGCRNHRRARPHGHHRSCSSQPWFSHPYAPRYWENDPNAGFAAGAPRPSSYAPSGINRGMPPAFAPQQAPPAAAFGAPRSGMQAPPLPPPNLPEARPWDAPQHRTPLRSAMDVKPQMHEASDAFSSLIEQFHKKGMLQEVDSVLRGMKVAQIILSLPAYRTLIDIYAQAGDLERMDLIYGEMRKATMKSAGHQLAEATPLQKQEASDFFAAMVDACHRKGLFNEVQQIHKAMKAAQLPISIPTYNVLMDVYGQLKDCDKMDAVYMEMRETLAQKRFPPPNASAHPWITSSAKESARSPPPPPPTLFNPAVRPGDGFHHQLQTPPPPPGWFSANMQPSPQFHQQQQSHGSPPTFGNLPFQPPPPGQHFQSGAGGPPPFQYPVPPGFPPGAVMNPSLHPPGQFQFQQQQQPPSTAAQVGAPLLQSFVAPAAGAVQQMVAPAPVEIQSAVTAALNQAPAAAEVVEEDQEEEVEEQETSDHEDQEAEDEEETETGEEQQESIGDTASAGSEEAAVETMVTAGDQPRDHPQLMESTG